MTTSPTDVTFYAWAVWFASWMVAALWSSRVERRSRSHADLAYRLLTAIGAVLLFDLHLSGHWSAARVWRAGNTTEWILAATTIAGFAVAWWARITLGRLWSGSVTRKVDHELISAGPYRMVRHPIYSGLLLSVAATAGLRGTAAAVLGAATIGIGLFLKARVEERFLRSELGSQRYDGYARRVPMLVPFTRRS
jgi:protein-S-isoprenylcysteine O-methyltransferase Ste14